MFLAVDSKWKKIWSLVAVGADESNSAAAAAT